MQMAINVDFNEYLSRRTSIAPLVVFRIMFGSIMTISIIRFCLLGWIDKLYIQPSFFFHIMDLNGLSL